LCQNAKAVHAFEANTPFEKLLALKSALKSTYRG
jgi:hypothetical protein